MHLRFSPSGIQRPPLEHGQIKQGLQISVDYVIQNIAHSAC